MDALCNVLADPFAIEEVAEHTEMIELVVHIMQSNDWDEQVRHSDMPGARFVLTHGRVEARLMWRPFAMLITAPSLSAAPLLLLFCCGAACGARHCDDHAPGPLRGLHQNHRGVKRPAGIHVSPYTQGTPTPTPTPGGGGYPEVRCVRVPSFVPGRSCCL
jgi:hypothetical protein